MWRDGEGDGSKGGSKGGREEEPIGMCRVASGDLPRRMMMMRGAGLGLGDESERCAVVCTMQWWGWGECLGYDGCGVKGGQEACGWVLERRKGEPPVDGLQRATTPIDSERVRQKYVPRFPFVLCVRLRMCGGMRSSISAGLCGCWLLWEGN